MISNHTSQRKGTVFLPQLKCPLLFCKRHPCCLGYTNDILKSYFVLYDASGKLCTEKLFVQISANNDNLATAVLVWMPISIGI